MERLERSREYKPRVFVAGQLSRAVDRLGRELGETDSNKYTLSRRLPDGTNSEKEVAIPDLISLCDLQKDEAELSLALRRTGLFQDKSVEVSIFGYPGTLAATIESPDHELLAKAFEILESELSLQIIDPASKKFGPTFPELIDNLTARVDQLETASRELRRPLTFFLSHRFDRQPAEQYAAVITRYLTGLGVKVVTGRSFEPRRLSDKLKERLQPGIDALVLIVDEGAESAWTRDELTRADTFGVPPFVLVESGENFSPGIHGDLEYIRFEKGHIGDAFLKILEGVLYLREATRLPF